MYGFEITVTTSAGQPALSACLDEITNQLAIACSTTDEFKGYMITERQSGSTRAGSRRSARVSCR